MAGGKQKVITTSKTVDAVTDGGKKGNPTVGYKTGVVKGVKKGKTVIYVFTQNGICKKVTVTVK